MSEEKKLDLDYLKVVNVLTLAEISQSKLIRWTEIYRLAKEIRAIRISRNVHSEALAKGMGISRHLYTEMEKGKKPLSIKRALYISKFFNLPITEVIAERWKQEYAEGDGYFGRQKVHKYRKGRPRINTIKKERWNKILDDERE